MIFEDCLDYCVIYIRLAFVLFLQVASQCLQTAFCLSQEDTHLGVSKTLEEIFSEATRGEPLRKAGTPSEEDRQEAEKMKVEGNELMRSENFEKAVEMYSK